EEGENARTYAPDETITSSDIHEPCPSTAQDITTEHHYDDDDWVQIQDMMENDEVLTLAVTGYNRGGLLVEWQSLRGFVPASQLVNFPAIHRDEERRDILTRHVGSTLQLRVIELNPDKNRLILSERAAQVESGIRHQLLHRLQPGDTTAGTITNLCDFGAFVDLGGVEGLIHISELSWGRVNHPADFLERGQNVTVHIMEVDENDARIALSLKRLRPDPWANADQRYIVGQTIEGEITNVVDFGAFVCIEEGLEGLIHYSELAEGHFLHPRNVISEGDIVMARILSINSNNRRMGLSLRPQ
ncbi:MAG: 30S ribosomal protein S1, partial [Aggregatilineales bacterium]